jgi:hypothetical protein
MKKLFMWGVSTLFALTILVNCNTNKDEESYGPTTVAEDKENIQASFDRVKNLLQHFRDGSLYSFADEFIDWHYYIYVGNGNGDYSYNYYSDKFEYTPGRGDFDRKSDLYGYYDRDYYYYYGYYDDAISEFVTLLGEKLEDVVNFNTIEKDKRFTFSKFTGEYTWDNNNKRWNRASHNSIIAHFPSSENQSANNCEAGITAYEDKACNIEGKTTYLPTKVNAYFLKGGIKLASVDITANYTNYGIPKEATAAIYAKPIDINASLTQESASKYKASLSIIDETDNNNNLSITCEAALSNNIDSYTDLDDCKINNLRFTVTQSAIVINGTVDLKTLNDINHPSATDINKCINLEVNYNNQKIGTLKVEEVGNEQYLYIFYKDGTNENTSIYYDSFVKDVEHIFKK